MDGLQDTFYVMGIIFMAITFIMIVALVAAVFVIRSKINKIHDNIENKLNVVSEIAEKGGELSAIASSVMTRKAKKVLKKSKKR